MFARVITFKIKPGTADDFRKRTEKEAVPWLRGHKEFHGLHLIRIGDTEMMAFEMWESKASAEAARQETEKRIQQIAGDLLAARPTFTEGEQILHAAGQEPHHRPGMHTMK
ncbi:MAG: antibiotic biosynthesis monooxygenase [Chloroflexi bacterium]|nr:antibiotic biosynthesis monooxygenase [Chloroflexota bacterium]